MCQIVQPVSRKRSSEQTYKSAVDNVLNLQRQKIIFKKNSVHKHLVSLTGLYLDNFKERVRKYSKYQLKTLRAAEKTQRWLGVDVKLNSVDDIAEKLLMHHDGVEVASDELPRVDMKKANLYTSKNGCILRN